MNRLVKYAGLATLVALIVALAISSTVAAQTPTPTTPQAPMGRGGFGGRGMCGQAGLDAAAKALKMTTDELTAQLWGGQTLSGLADKAGVKITDVQAAVQAACQQAQKEAIQQAVKDGKISQAQADWLIEGLDKGYWGGGKGGFGFGFGGFGMMGREHRGFGRFGMPKGSAPNNTTPTTPNSGTTAPSRFVF
jgi:hypothetical protein